MDRVLIASTPLGEAWWAVSLEGKESLSQPYAFHLELKSRHTDIDLQALLGEPVAVACEANLDTVRYFSGQIIHASAKGKKDKHALYEIVIAPKLWYASRRADYKIYQNRTIQDIADEVLQQNGINYEWRLKNAYVPREYIVQYGETDLDFFQRLLASEGIYYWFEHSPNGEVLILGDHFSTHEPFPGYADIPYYPPDAGRVDEDHFSHWRAGREPGPGRFAQRSYDFKHPAQDLTTESVDPRGHLFDHYEIYGWPGNYTEHEQGRASAAAQLEGLQGEQDTIHLAGAVRGAVPGCCFNLTRAPVENQNRQFIITEAHYQAANNDYESGAASEEGAYFSVQLAAIPSDRQYRPPKVETVRARGPETAVVVGPAGSEIHTDEYGRIKVHFHWDRYGQMDGNDSCWIRVVTPWAGSNFGTISLPRIGHEVLIDYEHGDPQRPIVTGSVYNAARMPPWELPAHKTQSGIMSRSTPKGSYENTNVIRFEDAKGQEEVWIHAERDRNLKVKRNDSTAIGADRTENVGGKHVETVQGDIAVRSVQGNAVHTAGGSIQLEAGSQIIFKVGESSIVMSADGTVKINGPQRVEINPDQMSVPLIAAAAAGNAAHGVEGKGVNVVSPDAAGGTNRQPAASSQAKQYASPLEDPKVKEIINQSPTLSADLKKLEKDGWTIEYAPGGSVTIFKTDTQGRREEDAEKFIIISEKHRNNPAEAVRSLSHETGHALYDVQIDLSSKEGYANSLLNSEGAAKFKNMQIREEILNNSGLDIGIGGDPKLAPKYNAIYDKYKANPDLDINQTYKELGKIMANEKPSGLNKTYRQFFEDQYVPQK